MSRLRPYQTEITNDLFAQFRAGTRRVLVRAPTGSGKTVMNGHVVRSMARPTAVIAHRSELVSQLAVALARERVPHRIIGPTSLVRHCQTVQVKKLKQHWVDPGARVGVAGVDTLIKKDVSSDSWFREVSMWAGDEAHHFLQKNKWGRGVGLFPHPDLYGVGWTATPGRADGKGLGASSHGVFDALVEGPGERDLIDSGYLTDYRIFAPPSNVVYDDVKLSADGDYSLPQLRAAVHASDQFVGDIVKHYLRIAPGKRGITFAVDVESAAEIARAFRAAGVPAEVVTGETDPGLRARIFEQFEAGAVLQLINVDIAGEGVDIPAVEVVIMARKTESLALFMQQFGRALRVLVSAALAAIWDTFTDAERLAHIAASGKPMAIIIDHVGNVFRHGLPDAPRVWSLDPRGSRSDAAGAIPMQTCTNRDFPKDSGVPCLCQYPRTKLKCPNCGEIRVVTAAERKDPNFVDGDLYELDPETLDTLRRRADAVMGAPKIAPPGVPQSAVNRAHQNRIIAQTGLRELIATWSGWRVQLGEEPAVQYRKFYHLFGIDMMSAQALNAADAEALGSKVAAVLARERIERMQ